MNTLDKGAAAALCLSHRICDFCHGLGVLCTSISSRMTALDFCLFSLYFLVVEVLCSNFSGALFCIPSCVYSKGFDLLRFQNLILVNF